MKKLIYTLALALAGTFAQAQVKVGANPSVIGTNSALEVEATNGNKMVIQKDNGNVGIGTATAGNKLEINSGAANQSGLRLSNINAQTPASSTATSSLGVDANGDVVVVSQNTASGVNCMPAYYFSTGPGAAVQVATGQTVVLNTNPSSNDIVSPVAGAYTLKAGNTYRLEAALYTTNPTSNPSSVVFITYSWYNAATNVRLPIQNVARSNGSGIDGVQPLQVAVFTPQVDTNVSLKVTSFQGTTAFWGAHSYLYIQQINPCR